MELCVIKSPYSLSYFWKNYQKLHAVGAILSGASVNEYTRERNLLVRQYHRSRTALELLLGTGHSLLQDHYLPISSEDLKISGDITEVNRFGQKNDRLPWFWRLQKEDMEEGSPAMNECELLIGTWFSHSD